MSDQLRNVGQSAAHMSGQLADPFKNLCLGSQQAKARIPLFHEEQENFAPSQMGMHMDMGSQLTSQDFITPADQQFDMVDGGASQQQTALVRQRSPAQLSPARQKRARAFSPSSTGDGLGEPVQPGPHTMLRGRPRKVPLPCYVNAFSANTDEEKSMTAWHGASCHTPPVSSGSRYRDDFKETGMLGQGSFSKVYSARHRLDGKVYAIKRTLKGVQRHSPEFRQFLQEVQILSNLSYHEGVIRYFGAWAEPSADGLEKLYMQLEMGQSTLKNFCLGEPLPERVLITIARQVLKALDHLHAHGIAHMDVKPSNIIIVRKQDSIDDHLLLDDGELKIADFGQATRCCPSRTTAAVQELAVYEGDCHYLPLEVMNADYSRLDKADIFSVGAMLFELASGNELPTGGQLYEDLRRGRVPLLPTLTTSMMNLIRYVPLLCRDVFICVQV